MLLLQFQAGNDRYGLDVSRIIEVIPMVIFRPLPHAAPAVAGLFNYHGTMAPVIDLTVLLTGNASRLLFSTRIIVVDYPGRPGQEVERHVLGLLAERVTETVFYAEEDLQPAGIAVEGASYLGDLVIHADGLVQRVAIERLLPPFLRENLFQPAREA
jgi:chemotaxis-related protein WspB